jgi:replicative DNA helicase
MMQPTTLTAEPELEAALVATIHADPQRYWDVVPHLPADTTDAFTVHGDAWEQLARAIEAGAPLPPLGGSGRLGTEPVSAARRLAELHQRRRLAEQCAAAARRLEQGEPIAELVSELQAALALPATGAEAGTGGMAWGDALVDRVYALAEEAHQRRESGTATLGFATGHASLDRLLNGLNAATLYILGGAPGAGKTSLAVQWACEVASQAEAPVVYVTFENPAHNLTLKAIGRMAGISPAMVERGRADLTKVSEGIRGFLPIARRLAFVEGTRRTTLGQIEARARQAMDHHRAGRCLIVVDYLQRMAYREGTDHQANIAALSLGLRELSNRLDSPILAISSLTRGATTYERPTLQSLQGSEDLEFAADVVLLLGDREEKSLSSAAMARTIPGGRLLDLAVAKNRFGEAGKRVPLLFRPATGDFDEDSRA